MAAPDITATATPWLGALRLAPLARVSASPVAGAPGRRTATRTLELAAESGGEANYIEGGDARGTLRREPSGYVTRRACASGRRPAYNCAAVSERATTPLGRGMVTSGKYPKGESAAKYLVALMAARSETCRSARKALAFYRSAHRGWRAKMGAGEPGVSPARKDTSGGYGDWRANSGWRCSRSRWPCSSWRRSMPCGG